MPVPDTPAATLPSRADVVRVLRAVNDYWIATHPDPGHNRWDRATYFSGDMALHRLMGERRYLGYAEHWAEAHRWGLNGGPATRHADNQCAGQAYLDLYELRREPRRIAAIERSVRNMVYGPDKNDDWFWVDALHMAMPCFVRLGALRRDPRERGRYWRKLYRLYDHTKRREGGGLYDRRPGHPRLWFRDRRFAPGGRLSRSPNGRPVYWSRGNGWALAAHVKVLEVIPRGDRRAPEYRQTLVDMCRSLSPLQRADGFWSANLGDPAHFPGPETSGTAFFAYGLAYGIRAGLLERATYLPVLARAWNGMVGKAVRADSLLGYVQGVGDRPARASAGETHDFGVGAFLLAGSEVAKLTA
jgi:unsaturated rhamnogalacturonyl hydrolase